MEITITLTKSQVAALEAADGKPGDAEGYFQGLIDNMLAGLVDTYKTDVDMIDHQITELQERKAALTGDK